MKTVRLGFIDFAVNWGIFPNPVRYFCDVLKGEYDIKVVKSDFRGQIVDTGEEPDAVICAYPGDEYKKYKCPKIFFPGEPMDMNLMDYDFNLTHHFSDDPRQYRLPLYALYGDVNRLTEPRKYTSDMFNRKFCCVLFGKKYPEIETPREDFYLKLSKSRDVDSAGTLYNNVGYVITPKDKAEFIKNYKFVLSFESGSREGFTTEKIFEPLLMNTIPVYWGNQKIGLDFNTKSFINAYDSFVFDGVLARMYQLDRDENLYREMIEQPAFVGNVVNEYAKKENIVKFFKGILG